MNFLNDFEIEYNLSLSKYYKIFKRYLTIYSSLLNDKESCYDISYSYLNYIKTQGIKKSLYINNMYSDFKNIDNLFNLIKNDTLIVPLLEVFLNIDIQDHELYFYYIFERFQDISTHMFSNLILQKNTNLGYKHIAIKTDNYIYKTLISIYSTFKTDSKAEEISLDGIKAEDTVSVYYRPYRDPYDVYLMDKASEKIEKRVQPLTYPLLTLPTY